MLAPVTGVILAAGDGGRLGALTASLPKALLTVGGRPLIAYTIEAMVSAGLRDLVVVSGYRGEELRTWLGDGSAWGCRIRHVQNRHFEGGNGYSLCRALDAAAGSRMLVTMADHLVSRELVEAMLDGDGETPRLAIDRDGASQIARREATKVRVSPQGLVLRIGKRLRRFDGIDAGVFHLLPDIVAYLGERQPSLELNTVVGRYARRPGGFHARDITGCSWWDVDTPADLAIAEGLVRRRGPLPA